MTNRAKILIVDDDPLNIRNAVRILKEEYDVVYATSGEKALEILEKDIPQLILLDLHMPGMNGFQVLERMKKEEKLQDIPVIFLTADSNQSTEVQGLLAGARDFIAKPFMDEIVKQRVKNILELDLLQKQLKEEVAKQTRKAEDRRKQMEEMSFQTVQALAGAIDAKDRYTKGHSARVAEYSILIAKELGWEKEKIDKLRYAALLHDVGKIGIPDSVLNKPGRLSDIEFGIIKSHTTTGCEILSNISTVEDAVDVARHHHERFDGTGYPDQLSGHNISEMARIVCIADAYDAMNSKRIYRNSLPANVIRKELICGRNTQFDPAILDVFLQLLDADKLQQTSEKFREDESENAVIIKRLFESVYDSGFSNQTDGLTGLPLRHSGEAIIREKMMEHDGALLLVDVDNLKKLNDLYGHKAGDDLLRSVGRFIAQSPDISGMCRVGGDEFMIFTNLTTREDVKKIIDSLYVSMEQLRKEDSIYKYNTLSCGVVMTTTTTILEDAYSHADKALYYAKKNGKDGYHFYQKELSSRLMDKNVDLDSLVNAFSVAGEYKGAMSVDSREFIRLFEYVKSMQKRYDNNVHLAMITMDVGMESSIPIEKISEGVEAMEAAIRSTIRKVDIFTLYSSMQYLIILFGSKDEEVDRIMDRIFSNFYKSYNDRRMELSYAVEKIRA